MPLKIDTFLLKLKRREPIMADFEISETEPHSLVNKENYSPDASPEVRPAKTPSFLASCDFG